MSEIFSIYESYFQSLSKKIESALNLGEFDSKSIKELRTNIQDINKIVKQMQLEINNIKNTKNKISKEVEQKLKNYKNLVNGYNSKLAQLQENINNNIELNDIKIEMENKNKNILIDDEINTQKQGLIEDEYTQQEKLNYIGRGVVDIEKMGNNISENLYGQGEQIKDIRENIFAMNHEVDVSNNLIEKIIQQARRNKMIMYGTGAVVIIIFIMVLISKFK